MRRRDLLALIGTAAGWPLAAMAPLALAQGLTAQRRIAFVHSALPLGQLTEASETPWVRGFFEQLRQLDYSEGRNLVIERYSAEGRHEQFANLAREVVNRKPELIVANLNPLVAAFQAATATIPIAAIVGDPVGYGLVASLARPGGNLTGVSTDAGIEVYGKRLQVLKETAPAVNTVAYLALASEWNGNVGRTMRDAGAALGITVTGLMPQEVTPAHLTDAFAVVAGQRVDGFIVSGSGDFLAHRQLIVELAERNRLLAIHPYRDYVQTGGLMAYAPETGDLARHLAVDVHQILQGARLGDIPIYQATKFELVINLKTAKTLGLTVPQSLLVRADEVIE